MQDLFIHDEISVLRHELEQLRQAQDTMRRGLFARHNEVLKTCMSLRAEVDGLKQVRAKKKATLVPFFGEYIEMTN